MRRPSSTFCRSAYLRSSSQPFRPLWLGHPPLLLGKSDAPDYDRTVHSHFQFYAEIISAGNISPYERGELVKGNNIRPTSHRNTIRLFPITQANTAYIIFSGMSFQARLILFSISLSISLAQSQDVSGQPTSPSSPLEILPAVELVFQTESAYRYKLHRSTNLIDWEQIETAYEGTGNPIRRFQSATPGLRVFYRLESSRIVPLPPLLSGVGGFIFTLGADTELRFTLVPDGRYIVRDFSFPHLIEEQGLIAQTNRLENSLSFVTLPNQTNASFHGEVQLDFTTPAFGTISLERLNSSSSTGVFRYFDNQMPLAEGTRLYATNLTGKNLQLAYANGGMETFEFISNGTLRYEGGAETGTYTYTTATEGEGGTTGRLVIQLGNGWSYEITISQGTAAIVMFDNPFAIGPSTVHADYVFY
jgi:hypothetical protein